MRPPPCTNCPFCGSKDIGAEYEDGGIGQNFAEDRGHYVYCDGCQARGPFCSEADFGEDSESEAVDEWDKMADAMVAMKVAHVPYTVRMRRILEASR